MAQFPRTEAEVAALAGPMATGLTSAATSWSIAVMKKPYNHC